jgi:DNA replicative helicase MCM subunit Mcm2 (Cdc46/Mcm family)
MEKATHILNSFTTSEQESFFDERELMTFINYAKKLTPSLKNDSKSKLLEIYERMRKASSQSQMPVGTRQLEALVRLSMAYAKLNLRNKVIVEDILNVEKLINHMYEAFGLSLEGNNIQQQIYFDNKNNKQHDAITIWNSCMDEDKTVSLKEFELELIASGTTENSSKHLIDRWEKNNVIKLKKNGRYERIG